MSLNSPAPRAYGAAVAAIVLAAALIASPLLVCVIIAAPLCLARIARGLPDDERRVLIALLTLALVLRAGLVAGQLLLALPQLNGLSVGALAGDEAYYFSRALRVRDLQLGYAATQLDYFIANDAYGQTSYVSLLTAVQVMFGPTPYSMKVANGLIYVCGAGLLFRVARAAFGVLPSYLGLAVLLFLPSLLFSSVTLLKESAYFFGVSVFAAGAWHAAARIRAGRLPEAVPFLAVAVVSVALIDGLRRGGLVLMAGGAIAGLAIWFIGQSRVRLTAAVAACAVGLMALGAVPSFGERAITGVEAAAKLHGGHVFTVGHVYKLLDEEFYVTAHTPAGWDLQLTGAEAARFVARAIISFAVTPWPWEMRSIRELAFLPEHMVWYLLIVALPFGIVPAWRSSPLATALLLGLAIPTAAVVAATNGNVGTLLRMRGLVTPFVVWISAAGWCAIGERLASASRLNERPAL